MKFITLKQKSFPAVESTIYFRNVFPAILIESMKELRHFVVGRWNDGDTIPVNFEKSRTFKRCLSNIEDKFNENQGNISRQEVIDVLKKNKVDKKFKTQGENLNLEITRFDDIDLTKLEQLRTKIKEIQRNKEEVLNFNEKLFTSKIFPTFKWDSSDLFPSFIEIDRDLNDFRVLNISMKSEVKPDKKPRKTLQKP